MQRTIPLCCYLVVLIFRPLPDLSPPPHLYENLDSPPVWFFLIIFDFFFFLLRYAIPPFSGPTTPIPRQMIFLISSSFFSLSLWSIWVEWEFILMTAQ